MKRFLLIALALPGFAFAAPACNCGPTYCVDTPEYTAALAAKKAAATKRKDPARLIALYDKLDRCEASIRMSPDSFNILRHDKDGSIKVDSWTAENEKNNAAAVKAGELKACWVMLARTTFACCEGAKPEDRPDWDSTLEMSKSTALPCK